MVLLVDKLLGRLKAVYTDRCCWWCGRFHFVTTQMCSSCVKRHAKIEERSDERPISRPTDVGLKSPALRLNNGTRRL